MWDTSFFWVTIVLGELQQAKNITAISDWEFCHTTQWQTLNYTHLRMAFDRNGYDGLLSILGEKVNGVVQVTKQGRIIQKIFEHFSQG